MRRASSGIKRSRDSEKRLRDLILDPATGIYVPPLTPPGTFAYTDGPEVENRLLQIVRAATDRTSMSEELEKGITDWPSQYHLSRQRADLLRALDWLSHDVSVLELGAGCGALTRYLGERFRKVDAVEGSLLRAQIAKERCRDLANVDLYVSPFQNVKFSPTYDIVTLIGVLEYAATLNEGSSANREYAWLSTLKLAASALRRNGVLILAVENPLGLKYWSGCGEDHTGRLFDGIHGYPNPKTPVTFSKKQTESLLRQAGLNHFAFYYPFPDYKFTRTIIRETPIPPASLFLHNWIEIPFYDYAGKRDYYIHEGLAVRQVCRAGLLHEFANSFLVLASKSHTPQLTSPWVARRLTSRRAKWYQCVTSLYADPKPRIEKTRLAKSSRENPLVRQRWSRPMWHAGDLETYSLDEALFQDDPFTAILEVAKRYHRGLLARFSKGSSDEEGYPLLRGDSFDFTFWNIIWEDHAQQYKYIDDEWEWKGAIPIDYVLFRSLYYYILSRRAYLRARLPRKDADAVLMDLITQLYSQYDSQRHQKNRLQEERVQTVINERESLLPSLSAPIVERTNIVEMVNQIEKSRVERAALVEELSRANNTIAQRDSTIQRLGAENEAIEREFNTRLQVLEEERTRVQSELRARSAAVNQLQEELTTIKRSFGYRFLRFYASRIDRLLPEDTRRGEFKKILVTSARIATEQGVSSLLSLAREKILKREFRVLGTSFPDIGYALWIANNEPTDANLTAQRSGSKRFGYRPLISIITPVWNPPLDVLEDTIESVLSQTYDNWELCIADGGSQEAVRDVLRRFVRRDKRVRVRFLDSNLGISGNSNMAIEWARGEFVALLDHDDMLAPFALFEVVECLNRMPELDFIYSDEDCATLDGRRFGPLLKPDWSTEMMLSANYVRHFCVFRTTLLKSIAGFRPEMDGAQDWDLILRVVENTDRICHLPKILYHWRLAPASVSSSGLQAKPYAAKAQLLTLNQYLARNMPEGEMRFSKFGNLRVTWRLDRRPKVSIIVHSQESNSLLHRCLSSIFRKSSYKDFEVVLVCTSDQLGTLQMEFPSVHLVVGANRLSYSYACNLGATHATGEVLVFVDPAIQVLANDWLEELAGWALQPGIGAVGTKILQPNGEIFHGGVIIGLPGYVFRGARERSWTPFGHTEWYRDYSAVSGLCIATRKEVFEEVGRFQENLNGAPDIEFCVRVRRRGYRVVYTPFARLLLDRSGDRSSAERLRLPDISECYQTLQAGDPYFNPNLSCNYTIPRLKWLCQEGDGRVA
jgi:glycosyltransferase involved in cell wall biosynthesis/SAM-dependent methyltransferase